MSNDANRATDGVDDRGNVFPFALERLADVQAFFEGYGQLRPARGPIRFGEKDTKESLLDLAGRMLEVLYRNQEPGTEIVGVEQPFDVPLIDPTPARCSTARWSARWI